MYNILVCMPYMPDWADPVWNSLNSKIIKQDTSKQLHMYRVDTSKFAPDHLAEKIEEELKKADVVIFDVTEVNPNVHIEIGFALALGKPSLFITQDRKWVTTHLQGRIIREYNANQEDSLTRLSTEMLFAIKEKLETIKAKETEMSLATSYEVECYSYREVVKLEKYFREARKRIDILTTNLSFLFEEYGGEISKDPSTKTYFNEIEKALTDETSNLKVRILTLDPESDFAAKRGKQLGFSPAVFRDALRAALKKTREVTTNYGTDRFEVRIYEDFPNQITYRIDSWIFNCVVAQPTQSRNHLTFKLNRRQAGVDNSFINHFQNVWQRASTG